MDKRERKKNVRENEMKERIIIINVNDENNNTNIDILPKSNYHATRVARFVSSINAKTNSR